MAPLRVATLLGLVIAFVAFIYGAQIVYETLIYGEKVPGYPSLFVGVMVLGGVQLIMLGVVGEYIAKILYEIKGRPVYFVAEHAVKLRRGSRAARAAIPAPPPSNRQNVSDHDDFGADLHAAVKVDDVGVAQANATRRHLGADRPGLVGAVNAIERGAEIERARAERIVRPPGT